MLPVPSLGADQGAAPESQLADLGFYLGEVLIVQLPGDHDEEPGEALGTEAGGVGVGDVPQPAEPAHTHLQQLPGAMHDGLRRIPEQPAEDLLLPGDRRHRDVVEIADDPGLGDAVGEHMLPGIRSYSSRPAATAAKT